MPAHDAQGAPASTDAPGALFAALARLIYDATSLDEVLHAVAMNAPLLITGCDHASVMLHSDGKFQTVASNDEVARQVDALECEAQDGPCVDAILDEAVQLDRDLTDDPTWPALAEALLRETPVRAMAGYRLLIDGRKAGALNVFSDATGGLTTDSVDQGAVLAAFASVALMAAANHERAESLQAGLASNREIGKAVGLLMATHKVGADQAFERLRRTSSELNMKLAAVAREVVDYHDSR